METKTFSDVSKYGVRYEYDEPSVVSDDTNNANVSDANPTETKTKAENPENPAVPADPADPATTKDPADPTPPAEENPTDSDQWANEDDEFSEFIDKFAESDLWEMPEDFNEEDVMALIGDLATEGNTEKLTELVKSILEERKILKEKVLSAKDWQSSLVSDGLSVLEKAKQKQKQNKELETELSQIKNNPLLSSLIDKTREWADLTEDLIDYVSEKKGVNVRELINGSKVDVNSIASDDRDSVSTRNTSGKSWTTPSGVRFEED